ncbi:CBL-interacting protein kinase 9 [Histomonas meleagridis]|uniref:CBL-interacting protein kinase 9 n=1 Tax=Histomonas meleagridis TaxID=135588 RepID=UPI003559D269|nr:CBL-interacting protein kinase 9 [Histomonas meleagridis]KAH0806435.1 CBL-interacting protein kinase 9 [Histomonas meleagridis]
MDTEDPSGRYRILEETPMPGPYVRRKLVSKIGSNQCTAHCVHRKAVLSTRFIDKLRAECEVLGSVHHNLIQSFIESTFNSVYFQIVESEDVNLIHHYRSQFPLKESSAKIIFNDLLVAVSHLHSNQIVHLDIRPENVFIVDGKFKLGCFFNAKFLPDDGFVSGAYGTPNFQAPEIFTSEKYDGKKADVWACGIFLYSILSGHIPFISKPDDPPNLQIASLGEQIVKHSIEFPPYFSDKVNDLLEKILVHDPAKRPSVDELLNHPWLAQDRDENDIGLGEVEKTSNKFIIESLKTLNEIEETIRRFFDGPDTNLTSAGGKSRFKVFVRKPFQTGFSIQLLKDEVYDVSIIEIKKLRADSVEEFENILQNFARELAKDDLK